MAYRLARAAADDLAAIFAESVLRFGLTQADIYYAGLYRVFDFLAAYPRSARLRGEVDPAVRAHPHKAHIVVYEIDGDDILILRVRHGHEDWLSDPA